MSIPARAALAAAALMGTLLASGCTQAAAQGQEEKVFWLEPHDKIIAEAPGCSAECKIVGGSRRQCVVSQYDCRAICTTLPECRPDGMKPMKACAVVRSRP